MASMAHLSCTDAPMVVEASRLTIYVGIAAQPDQSACRVIWWLARLREILWMVTRRRTQANHGNHSQRILVLEMRHGHVDAWTDLTDLTDLIVAPHWAETGCLPRTTLCTTVLAIHVECTAPCLGFDSFLPSPVGLSDVCSLVRLRVCT
jgi:hypothetical protein